MRFILCFIFLIHVNLSSAYQYPEFTGYINDYENLLPKIPTFLLTKKIEKKYQDSNRKLLLLTTPSFGDKSNSKDFLVELYKKWELKKEDLYNTVVLFISKSKSEVRLFVGKDISSDFSKRNRQSILDDIIRPNINKGKNKIAIKKGLKAILSAI